MLTYSPRILLFCVCAIGSSGSAKAQFNSNAFFVDINGDAGVFVQNDRGDTLRENGGYGDTILESGFLGEADGGTASVLDAATALANGSSAAMAVASGAPSVSASAQANFSASAGPDDIAQYGTNGGDLFDGTANLVTAPTTTNGRVFAFLYASAGANGDNTGANATAQVNQFSIAVTQQSGNPTVVNVMLPGARVADDGRTTSAFIDLGVGAAANITAMVGVGAGSTTVVGGDAAGSGFGAASAFVFLAPGLVNPPEPGDDDFDGDIDDGDIDLITIVLPPTDIPVFPEVPENLPSPAAEPPNPRYDLNLDGKVGPSDKSFLVQEILNSEFGDANLDGTIDIVDSNILLANWGGQGGWGQADFDGNGVVDQPDLNYILGNWGWSHMGMSISVPEPFSNTCLALVLLSLPRRLVRSKAI